MGWRLFRWFWREDAPAPAVFTAAGPGRVIIAPLQFRTIRVPVEESAVIPSFSPKPPGEVDVINFDFSERCARLGDTIAAIVSVEVVDGPDDALVLTDQAMASAAVSAGWSGGTLWETYTLECVVTTTAGRTWPQRATVTIAH